MVSASGIGANSRVGLALSEWHAGRMVAHKDIVTVMTKQARKLAIGNVNDFPNDHVVTHMSRHAEEIFEPKRILTDGDWLKTYREPDQRFDYYRQGKGNIKWLSATKNRIYLFIADTDSFTDAQIGQYKAYAAAFFTGVASVEVIRAGEVIPGQNPNRASQRTVPIDFLSQVNSREGEEGDMQYQTCGANGILNKLANYRPQDSYGMLCITMKDLFPGPKWNFCFGWASFTEGVGAFSFCRYDPEWDGIEDPDRDKNLLMRGCAIMCHEIGHQFGLRHCVYYECLMNGINSATEQRAGGIRILCPVCHKKLKQNLKFDSAERFQKLAAACDQLGFPEEAAVYRKILKDAVKTTPANVASTRQSNHIPTAESLLGLPGSRRSSRRANSTSPRQGATTKVTGANKKPSSPKIWR